MKAIYAFNGAVYKCNSNMGGGDPKITKTSGAGHEVISSSDGAVDSVTVSRVLDSVRSHISSHHAQT